MKRRNFLRATASGVLITGINPFISTFNSGQSSTIEADITKSSKPILKFRDNGRFRIMQLTDIHYKGGSGGASSLELMRSAILIAQPDFIVLTGDIVMTNETVKAWTTLTDVLAEAKIPWSVAFGNHDQEFELTKSQILKILAKQPYNMTENGPDNIPGNGNYVLKIGSSKHPEKVQAALYCFDSRQLQNVIDPPNGNAKGNYDWISFDQIGWYREQSRKLTAKNGGNPLPALAFFHIPLPEYNEILGKPTTVGQYHEKVCSSQINSGLFTSMCECKDVMGVFVGHDHTNNYIGKLHNICLAYGYVSGRQASKGFKEIGCGVRVIELIEGERKFDTWLLQLCETGPEDKWEPIQQVEPKLQFSYPESFK
jgi:predicted phosphodiesterase